MKTVKQIISKIKREIKERGKRSKESLDEHAQEYWDTRQEELYYLLNWIESGRTL